MSIKVGDRVVCIDDSGLHCTNVLKNREYVVYGVYESNCGCGVLTLDVGLHSFVEPLIDSYCQHCKATFSDPMPHCLRVVRFRKVEERTNYVKLEIEIEEPIYS